MEKFYKMDLCLNQEQPKKVAEIVATKTIDGNFKEIITGYRFGYLKDGLDFGVICKSSTNLLETKEGLNYVKNYVDAHDNNEKYANLLYVLVARPENHKARSAEIDVEKKKILKQEIKAKLDKARKTGYKKRDSYYGEI